MGTGFLEVVVITAYDALPIFGARVTVLSGDEVLYELTTDESGLTERVALEAPAMELTLDVNYDGVPYSVCDVRVEAEGFATVTIHDVEIFDTETSILPVHMQPAASDSQTDELFIPPHNLVADEERRMDVPPETMTPDSLRVLSEVIIPEFITVHLGRPDRPARNVRVPFLEYIKNSASHEIFPTWPEASLEANIYCIISLTLNRIFTNMHRLGNQKKRRKYGVCWQCDFTKTEEVEILRLYMYRLCMGRKNVVVGDGVFLFSKILI